MKNITKYEMELRIRKAIQLIDINEVPVTHTMEYKILKQFDRDIVPAPLSRQYTKATLKELADRLANHVRSL